MKLRVPTLMLLSGLCVLASACGDDTDAFDPTNGEKVGIAKPGDACKNDRICQSGLKCEQEVCVFANNVVEGAPCRRTGECAPGLYCEPALAQCQPAGQAQEGQACSGNADCEAGLSCTPRGLGASCAQPGQLDVGASCSSGADCFAGLSCASRSPGEPSVCTAGQAGLPLPWSGVDCQASRQDEGPSRFYFEVPDSEVTEFYRLPYPNDIRLKGGRPDLSGHPTPGPGVLGFDIVANYIEAIGAGQQGFGFNHATYVRASQELDFKSLEEADAIRLINIDPDSPDYNKTHPISWFASGGSGSNGRYICQNWLSVRPFWGRPLAHETTYAVVLSDKVKDKDGARVEQDEDFKAMLATARPADDRIGKAWDAYAPLRAWITEQSLNASSVSVAAVFTTGTPWEQTSKLRAPARGAGLEAKALTLCEAGVKSPCDDGLEGAAHKRGCFGAQAEHFEVQGTLELPIFQRGQAPYLESGGDLAATPKVERDESVCMAMSVPKQAAPAEGWPVLIYAHGTGGTYRSHIDQVSGQLASLPVEGGEPVGMIVVGWDQVQHGSRRGMSTLDPEPLVFNYGNPAGAKGNFLQAAGDIFAITKFVEGLDIPAERSPTGQAIKADPTRIYFMGHSQGGTSGPLALPFEPNIKAAVLSGAGGGLNLALLYKSAPVSSLTGLKIALQDPDIGSNHPVLSLIQGYYEPVDPINYASYMGARQIEGLTSARHIFQPFGTGDTYTPPQGMKALALALRAIYLNPIFDEFKGGGIAFSDDPVKGNASVAGERYTVVGRQYEPDGEYDGHFVSFRNPKAKANILEFLRTAITAGTPTVSP